MTTTAPPPRSPRRRLAAPDADGTPRRAEGVELLGEYEDSGFKDAPYIVRAPDGQMVQLPRLLYAVVEHADGQRSFAEIAERVSADVSRGVSGENVQFLIEKKLLPLGVMAHADGSTPAVERPDPLLALKFRTAVVPDRVVRAITSVFRPLFLPPVVLAVVAGLVALDGWLLFHHGIAQPLRQAIYDPALLLVLFGGVVLATTFHEIGHATACRYGGAKPGVMGVGIYIIWPAFYTDVTDAYRLGRGGRLRTDLGGVYFNAVFALAVGGVYFATGFEPILLLALIQNFAILQQLLPFLRLDGYYVISDLTGVPDMFARVKPTLKSMLPGQETPDEVEVLKPWVRRAVTMYVLLLIPALLFSFALMILHAPRAFATAYDSLGVQYDKVSRSFGDHRVAAGIGGTLQMATLVLPSVGMVLTTGRVGRRIGKGAWSWSADSRLRRGALVGGGVALVGLAAWTWWPNGDYRPIQPNERGTLQGGIRDFGSIPSGRPALTVQRARQLHGAPTERSRLRHERNTASGASSGGGSTTVTAPTDTSPTQVAPTQTTPATGTATPVPAAPTQAAPTQATPTQTTPTQTTPTQTTPTQTTTTQTTPTQTTTTPTTTVPPTQTTTTPPPTP